MKQLLLISLLLIGSLALIPGNMNSITVGNGWKFTYSISDNYLYVSASVTNNGSVAIAFGGKGMNGMDVAHLSYDGQAVKITDRNFLTKNFGFIPSDMACGGKEDFEDTGSTFDPSTGNWAIHFRRLLDTKDASDIVITNNMNLQLAFALFSQQAWGTKHTKINALNVQLSASPQSSLPADLPNQPKVPTQPQQPDTPIQGNTANQNEHFTFSSKLTFFSTILALISIFA